MILPLVFIIVSNIFYMVNEKFIRNVVPLNKFVLDIFVMYGDRFRFEFYDRDWVSIDGRVSRMIYEISFTDKNDRSEYYERQHLNFCNVVYAIIYNHYVNYMITDKEEVRYIWDILVSEYNTLIEGKVTEIIKKFVEYMGNPNYICSPSDFNVDYNLIYFPTYGSYLNKLIFDKLRGESNRYNIIRMCESIPCKYSNNMEFENIFIEHNIL